jgi:hypothetical protein
MTNTRTIVERLTILPLHIVHSLLLEKAAAHAPVQAQTASVPWNPQAVTSERHWQLLSPDENQLRLVLNTAGCHATG